MSCYNCNKDKAFHIADGLWLCRECEKELSKQEQLKIQAEKLGVTVSDITAAEDVERTEDSKKSPQPDAWKWKNKLTEKEGVTQFNGFEDAETVEEEALYGTEKIKEAVEKRWNDVDNYKIETKFEEEAKDIVRHQLKQLLIDLGIVEREVSINGMTLEEVFNNR